MKTRWGNERMEQGVIDDIKRVKSKGKSFNEIPKKIN